MRYLVTGGAGFIGSHLVEHLVAAGEDVIVLDDLSAGRRENLAAVWGRVRFVEGSVTHRDTCRRVMEGVDCVVDFEEGLRRTIASFRGRLTGAPGVRHRLAAEHPA
jgi:nucleoside-diphosphate-sugar epimerase